MYGYLAADSPRSFIDGTPTAKLVRQVLGAISEFAMTVAKLRGARERKRREVGMDEWGWEQLRPWLELRACLPIGALFCVLSGPTRGRPWSSPAIRTQFRLLAAKAKIRRRFAPHQLRHAHAVEMPPEGVPLNVIQRQLGHRDLGVTSVYLQGIDSTEVISAVHGRSAPTMSASAGLLM